MMKIHFVRFHFVREGQAVCFSADTFGQVASGLEAEDDGCFHLSHLASMFIQISRSNFSLHRLHPFFSFPSSSSTSKLNKYSPTFLSFAADSFSTPLSIDKNEWELTLLFFFVVSLLDRSVELLCSIDLKFFANNQSKEHSTTRRIPLPNDSYRSGWVGVCAMPEGLCSTVAFPRVQQNLCSSLLLFSSHRSLINGR